MGSLLSRLSAARSLLSIHLFARSSVYLLLLLLTRAHLGYVGATISLPPSARRRLFDLRRRAGSNRRASASITTPSPTPTPTPATPLEAPASRPSSSRLISAQISASRFLLALGGLDRRRQTSGPAARTDRRARADKCTRTRHKQGYADAPTGGQPASQRSGVDIRADQPPASRLVSHPGRPTVCRSVGRSVGRLVSQPAADRQPEPSN